MRRPHLRQAAVAGALLAGTLVGFWMLLGTTSLLSLDQMDFYLRTHEYAAEWRSGHWAQDLPHVLRGGGHAFPRFYPPLPHWLAALVYLVVGDIVVAGHVVLLAAVFLSGVSAAWFVGELTGSLAGALLGGLAAIARMYMPVVIFFRGAFSEVWTFVWYPLLLLGVWRLARGRSLPRWWAFAAAALVLSHTVMAAWTLPVVVLLALLAAPSQAERQRVALDVALAAGLCAFFVAPMLWYKAGVRVADPVLMGSTPHRMVTVLAAVQWPWQFGVVEMLVLGACAWAWRRRRPGSPTGRALLLLLAGQAAYYALAAAPEAVWHWVPGPLRYVQFPLRLHGPAGLLLALAIGIVTAARGPRLQVAIGAIAVAMLVAWAVILPTVLSKDAIPRPLTHNVLMGMLHGPYADRGLTMQAEYLPRTSCESLVASIGGAGRRLLGDTAIEWRDAHLPTITLPPGTHGEIPLPLVAYDFHRVTDAKGRPLVTRDECGQLVAVVPPGTVALRIERRLPPVLLGGMGISVLSLLALVGVRRERHQGPSRRA